MWTYSGDPTTSARDEVRFLIGDTNENDPQLSDTEIDYLLLQTGGNAQSAALRSVEGLISQYSRLVDKSIGDLSISYSQRKASYMDLLKMLRRQASLALSSSAPYAGGISVSDKLSREADPDRVIPAFKVGMHENTGSEGE